MKSIVEDVFQGTYGELLSVVRMGQFLSVGILGAVVDNAVLVAVVEFAAVQPTLAKIASAEAAIVLMFLLNENWTFSETGTVSYAALARRFLTSNTVRIGGAATALVVLHVLHEQFGVWYLAANVAGIGVGFVVNYVLESRFTWRVIR
ncbi:GtrA family protein [Halorientalis marina]|jgi:putative flippase GtrA|uniref:GtrA family protein n=1 Tax=Halorientalis marina TaxID=2931976 RepID=UPI001FF3C2A8|nr:GtrA family protein [Halorientalis marina]